MRFNVVIASALLSLGVITSQPPAGTFAQEGTNECAPQAPLKEIPAPNGVPFGRKTLFESGHTGEDYVDWSTGTLLDEPVYPILNGTIVFLGNFPSWGNVPWENTVVAKSECGDKTLYFAYVHLSEKSLKKLRVGGRLEHEKAFAVVGRCKVCIEPHLHVGRFKGGIDPLKVESGEIPLTPDIWVAPFADLPRADTSQTTTPPVTGPRPEVPEWTPWERKFLSPEAIRTAEAVAFLLSGLLMALMAFQTWFAIKRTPRRLAKLDLSLDGALTIASIVILPFILAGFSKYAFVPTRFEKTTRHLSTAQFQAAGEFVGYGDVGLLTAFYQVAAPRKANGRLAATGEAGVTFPPSAAAVITFGETNAKDNGQLDPTQPGVTGRYIAWDAVAQRWPPSTYEQWVLGLTVSRTAQTMRDGITTVAAELGVEPTAIYGSSSGALGRTQILPSYFAPGGLCSDAPKDVWNDRVAIAECTTRHLVTHGCWGSYAETGDVWSALCGYNPGAWDVPQHQWYWDVLRERMALLEQAETRFGLREQMTTTVTGTAAGDEKVPLPIIGLELSKKVLALQGGAQPNYNSGLEQEIVEFTADKLNEDEVANIYRVFRAYIMVFFTPEELVSMGVTP